MKLCEQCSFIKDELMARPDMFCRSHVTGTPFVDSFKMLEPDEVVSLIEKCPENCVLDEAEFHRRQELVDTALCFEGTDVDWVRKHKDKV